MTWTLVNSDAVLFSDGNTGHVYTYPSGAPAVGDLDILCVNSDTTVTTPSGLILPTNGSFVGNQGAYFYYRYATGGEGSTSTITTAGNFSTHLAWMRWQGGLGFDLAVNAHVDGSSGNSTPAASTGTLGNTGELVVGFAAVHNIGGAMTSPVWSSGYTGVTATSALGGGQAAGFTGYNANAGTASESPSVSWSGGSPFDRYMLVAAFTAAVVGGAAANEVIFISGPGPRPQPVGPRLIRSTLVDPPVLTTPKPLVVSASPRPPAALALAGRSSLFDATTPPPLLVTPPAPVLQGVRIVGRGSLADAPVLTTAAPLVASPGYRPPSAAAILARSSLVDVVVTPTPTPQPLVVTPPVPGRPGVQLVARGALVDAPVLTTAPPLVVSAPYRPPAPGSLLSRSSLADDVTPSTATPQPIVISGPGAHPAGVALLERGTLFDPPPLTTVGPLVVGNPVRPGRAQFVWQRSSLVDVVIPPTTFTPAPLVVTAPTVRTQAVRPILFAPVGVDFDCTIHRPFTGTVSRPSTGTLTRPSTGVVQRPCVC